MKALVLSGGTGTRLRPFSHSMPKQLMPIAGKSLLEHVVANIVAIGVTDIGVVVGSWAEQISATLGDGSRFGARITYIRQDGPLGLAHCVVIARDFLGDDDFVMYLGDNFLPDGIADIAREFRGTDSAAHVLVRMVEDPRAFGVAELDSDGSVLRLVEKPANPRSNLALIGVYMFTPAIHEAVRSIRRSARGELEITDAVQWLLDNGADVRARQYSGYWKDAGHAEDLLECNRHVLGSLPGGISGHVDGLSVLTGVVVVEAGARVVRSRVEGPAIIGRGTVVEDSHIGPDTAIGRDCVLRSATLSDSIVLDGASISDVSAHGSVVGRGATVSNGRTRHKLVVGDHARVEIAA